MVDSRLAGPVLSEIEHLGRHDVPRPLRAHNNVSRRTILTGS